MASESYLSRPDEPEYAGHSGLLEHSIKVAERAKDLISNTNFDLQQAAYFSGLLHDLGKLNPLYQKLFRAPAAMRKPLRESLKKQYFNKHSLLSSIVAYRLLQQTKYISISPLIISSILSHHSSLKHLSDSIITSDDYEYPLFLKSRNGMVAGLKEVLPSILEKLNAFYPTSIDLDLFFQKFEQHVEPQRYSSGSDPISEYLNFSVLYSALLHADRGSFLNLPPPSFDYHFNTSPMLQKGKLADLRTAFANEIFAHNDFQSNVMVLNAPTGIGKTKIFLDIINSVQQQRHFERIYYFSPLLALTDDFETKMFKTDADIGQYAIAGDINPEDVLIYNYTFHGTLKDHNASEGLEHDDADEDLDFDYSYKTSGRFEIESFNKKLIVTTTQRLLMILYSNSAGNKMKLLSFKNSFLIIDEVQTIPKFLLDNFLKLLILIAKKLNSTILFVSATIPSAFRNFKEISYINTPECIAKNYLRATLKEVKYRKLLPNDISSELSSSVDGPNLIMVNTRKKAVHFHKSMLNDKHNLQYLSSGVKKIDRKKRIKCIKNSKNGPATTVVSTQVIEAGIDISFKRMYREIAPLDNIIQAMGRLNRECDATSPPILHVFEYDGLPVPYIDLELNETREILKKINNSIDLYSSLPAYYSTLQQKNKTSQNLSVELNNYFKSMNHIRIWDFINNHLFKDSSKGVVYLPPKNDLDNFVDALLGNAKNRVRILNQKIDYTAELPVSPHSIRQFLNPDLFEVGIFVPEKSYYDVLYNEKIGLDVLLENPDAKRE